MRERILNGTPGQTRASVLRSLEDEHVKIHREKSHKLRIYPPTVKSRNKDNNKKKGEETKIYFQMQNLKAALPDVIVQGIPSVSRAVISTTVRNVLVYSRLY